MERRMTRRPIIGVAWPKSDYVASLEQAGADVRQLQPDADALPAALDTCDGVLLTGGADVDPVEYGDAERHASLELDPARDRYELALARAALDRNVPLFAICRGAQVLNVAGGGTLVQDIPSQVPGALPHSLTVPPNQPYTLAHEVWIDRDTVLGALLGERMTEKDACEVNSRHHQAVKDIAKGFSVSATAPDGIIEAIEDPAARFCVGVQWHPENFWRTGEFRALFEGFVAAATRT
jgi:putative glutamine amidotransferase